jgi:predicted short-subunit dehydrogenase-like oxidoreductase (DUF2520 family)
MYSIENLVYHKDPGTAVRIASAIGAPSVTDIAGLGELSSDIVLITTRDTDIASVAGSLISKISNRPIVFHTSGALSSEVLASLADAGSITGSIHPLVSVSSPQLGPERFKGAYFCIEGHEKATRVAKQMVESLGGTPFTIASQFKTLYHASAVTACGHLVALVDAAVEMMSKCGLSPEQAKEILLPLVVSTVQNLGEQSTSAALTGTFARADVETFVRHLQALNTSVSDELLEIYLLLGERSLELAAKEGVSPDRIDKLRARVSVAKSKLKW